jgi:hypothetical protein
LTVDADRRCQGQLMGQHTIAGRRLSAALAASEDSALPARSPRIVATAGGGDGRRGTVDWMTVGSIVSGGGLTAEIVWLGRDVLATAR